MKISPLGDSALTVDFADEFSDRDRLLARAFSAASAIERANIPGIVDITSAYQSVAIFFDQSRIEENVSIEDAIRSAIGSTSRRPSIRGRRIEIPVCYDNEFALDLARVAAETKLTADTIIALHASGKYVVACIGFMPGFPFLAGLDEKLQVPRLATPRTKVPAGSVAIANAQAGIYPSESPGGWNVIGRTSITLFDPRKNPPTLLRPGDRVRFRGITRDEFDAISSRQDLQDELD
jgi:inhibitor of KinA